MPTYDRADRLILETLQNDASLSNAELAERIGLRQIKDELEDLRDQLKVAQTQMLII